MKKALMTIGFAAVTMLAVQAQDATSESQSIDETQEEVVEMQGENAESALNQDQEEPMAITGAVSVEESELPEEVTQGLLDSEFGEASIEKAYQLNHEAIDQLLEDDAEQIEIGDPAPSILYHLQVKDDDEENILYFDEQGELLGSKSM